MTFKKTLTLTTLSLLLSTPVLAHADIQTDTINELWGKPTLVYGAGLSDNEVLQTNKAFHITNIDNVNRQVNSSNDFNTYLNQPGVSDNSLFSSVLVQKQNKGKGVTVDIKTPQNITQVTESQYANAAITAGATDVAIDVASVKKVTGESALVGVYKALSANGVAIDNTRTQAASQELNTINNIAENHKDQSNFDPKALDLATAQIKKDLADYKDKNGTTASNTDVQNIIKKALSDNNIGDILSNNEINNLVSFANVYQNSSAIDSKEVTKQLEDFSKNTYDKLSSKFKNAINPEESKNILQNILTSIQNFFVNIWNALTGKD